MVGEVKIALYPGRFQPFHNGHLYVIKRALKKCDKIIIAIGSAQYANTSKNPFTYVERWRMIDTTLQHRSITDYSIIPIPDINHPEVWVKYIKDIVGEFDIVYTNNQDTLNLITKENIPVQRTRTFDGLSGTEIRQRIINSGNWRVLVPFPVQMIIDEVGGVDRIKMIHKESK